MDDEESRDRQRISSSRRRQRWSMCSEKLEQIVKEIMKPVRDHGHCFDRDDAGLLEEYLTEAGLRLLARGGAAPNFAEIGLLLQSYACNYSRKVDHLMHLALRFRSELSGLDCESPVPDTETEPSPRRRRALGGGGGGAEEFSPIVLRPAPAAARRAAPPPGPPPALPRQYFELSPREPRPDRALRSDLGEPIGSLDDFYVTRRTRGGFLVDELEADEEEEEEEPAPAEPLSLLDLQAAIERGAPAPPPPAPPPPAPPRAASPPAPATPPPELAPLYTSTPLPTPVSVRKRKLTVTSQECVITIVKNVEKWRRLPAREFALPRLWVRRVVRARRDALLSLRRDLSLTHSPSSATEFRGFNTSWTDIGGFRGWGGAEGAAARAAARRLSAALLDSEDDGFFERSSASLSPGRAELAQESGSRERSWQEEVAARAARAAPLDVAALARDVRRALPAPPAPPLAWRALLAGVRRAQPRPARVLLDVLSKATRGELDVLPGAPGRVGDFGLRLREPAPRRAPDAPDDDAPPPPDP